MINLHSIVFMTVAIFCWSGAFYLIVSGPNITIDEVVEQQPKLYCQYGAGYGVAVYDHEDIGNGDILTDADDVFNLVACEDWLIWKEPK